MASENSFNGNNRNALIDQMDWNSLEKENINVDTLEQDRNSPVRSPAQDTPRKTESSSKKSSGAKLYAYAQQRQRAHFDAAKSKENIEQNRNGPLRSPAEENARRTDTENLEKNSSRLQSYAQQLQRAYQHFDAAKSKENFEQNCNGPLRSPAQENACRTDTENLEKNSSRLLSYSQKQQNAYQHFDAAKSKENFEQDRNDPLRRPSQENSPQTDNFEKNSSHLLSYTKQHQNAYQHFDAAQNNGNNENVQQQNYYYAPLPYPVRDTVSRPDNFQLNPMNPYYYTQQQRDFNSYAIRAYHGWGGRGTFA